MTISPPSRWSRTPLSRAALIPFLSLSLLLGACDSDSDAEDTPTEAPVTFAVSFSGNGAFGTPPPTVELAMNESMSAPSSEGMAALGHAFVDWNTASSGSGGTYAVGDTIEMVSEPMTLFAQWTPTTFTVTYDGNGSDGGDVPVDAASYSEGASVTVLGEGTLTLAGSTFVDWNTAPGGSGTAYNAGDSFSMATGDVTLYAQWTPATYAVAYDGNGSDSGSVPVDAGSYLAGASVTVLGEGTLTLTANTFTGWNTLSGGGGVAYAASDTLTMPAADVTLYAQWVPTTYSVTYDGNGSDGGTTPVDPSAYLPGATVTVLSEGTLTLSGATFGGWNTEAGGAGTDYAASDTFAMPSADVTLYAKWSVPASVGTTPGDAQVYLTWTDVSGATEYRVYYHTADDQGAATVWNDTVGLINSTSSTVHGLVNSTQYYFWVGAVTSGGETLVVPGSETATPLSTIFSPQVSSIEPGENALEVSLDKKVVINFNQALDPATVTTSTVTVSDGSSVPVTLALGSGNMSIEIDPQSGTWSEGTTQTVTLTTGIQAAGGDPLAAPFSFSFTTLSNADLLARWGFNASTLDISGNAVHASITNGTFNSSSFFEGTHSLGLTTSSIVDIGVFDLGEQFTYTAWVNVTSASSILTLFGNGSAGFNQDGIKVFVNEWSTTNRKIVIESGNGVAGLQIATDENFVTFGDWFHVAVAIDRTAGECYFYFNGVQATTYDFVTGNPSIAIRTDFNNNAQTYLNQFVGGSFKYQGLQDDVRFYNRVLSAAEVANIANEN